MPVTIMYPSCRPWQAAASRVDRVKHWLCLLAQESDALGLENQGTGFTMACPPTHCKRGCGSWRPGTWLLSSSPEPPATGLAGVLTHLLHGVT